MVDVFTVQIRIESLICTIRGKDWSGILSRISVFQQVTPPQMPEVQPRGSMYQSVLSILSTMIRHAVAPSSSR